MSAMPPSWVQTRARSAPAKTMRIADMYFVEELRRTVGVATASAWLLQEQMNRESRTSGAASPMVPCSAASASSEEEGLRWDRNSESDAGMAEEAGARHAGSEAGGTHQGRGLVRGLHAHDSGNKSPARCDNNPVAVSKHLRRPLPKSKSESSSPQNSRRESPGRPSRITSSSSSERARQAGGGDVAARAGSQAQRDQRMDSVDVSRIQQVLEAGGANAGLIFTDAAHSVDLSSGQKRGT